MRTIKFLLILLGTVGIILLAYLVIPDRFISALDRNTDVGSEKVVYSKNALNNGEPCAANTIYVFERSKKYNENEGYEFVVNDDCADLQQKLVGAIRERNAIFVRELLSDGANAGSQDRSRFDAVFPLGTALSDDVETIRLLLDNGADVNSEFCCCAMCNSILTKAIRDNQPDTVRFLLRRGANAHYRPSFSDEDRLTPCEIALKQDNVGITEAMSAACDDSLRSRVLLRWNRLVNGFSGKR